MLDDALALDGPRQYPDDVWFDLCAYARERGHHPKWARHSFQAYTGRAVERGRKFEPRRGGCSEAVRAWARDRAREYAIRKQREKQRAFDRVCNATQQEMFT